MEKKYPQLCVEENCTGCGACEQICAFHAIKMTSNKEGFLHPIIDADKCTNCKACERACPVVNLIDNNNFDTPVLYAAWNKNEDVRRKSSSGGMFSAIAEQVLINGGYVWGAAFDENMHLTYQCVNKTDDLDKLRRSKYVQSKTGDMYSQIKNQLKTGKLVLFTGTSCHVAGLYSYLRPFAKLVDNLLTIDFVCHGVASPMVFKTYLEWLEMKYDDKVVDYNFRDKTYGTFYTVMSLATFENKGKVRLYKNNNSYVTGMMRNLYLRDCCYDCKFNGIKRIADFTIGDFWGLGKDVPFAHQKETIKGISLLAINSCKADKFFNNYLADLINFEQRKMDEAVSGNGNYTKSSKKSPKADCFWNDFIKADTWGDLLGYFKLTNKEYIKYIVNRYLGHKIAKKLKGF